MQVNHVQSVLGVKVAQSMFSQRLPTGGSAGRGCTNIFRQFCIVKNIGKILHSFEEEIQIFKSPWEILGTLKIVFFEVLNLYYPPVVQFSAAFCQ